MSDPFELKKAKIDSLVMAFTNSGYKSSNRIGQIELLQFLNKLTSSGNFDHILADKLFQVLSLDHMSTISVEDFINGYLQFEEDLRKNIEIYTIKLKQEQELYYNLVEQCKRYKSEKLNSEGLCEDAKVFGEITDIDIKKKLEGIKEIIIKVIYNDKFEELHFKIGDSNSSEMLKKSFAFKPTSRKDHFEFIMKGVNDRNQVFDIGSKVFSLTDINSYEEYVVQIIIPEIENEEQVAAYINAKIVLYWSDFKYFDRLRRKAESRLRKLIAATNKAEQYLQYIREIYGDLTRKKSELIVDFNNEKIMQKKGGKLQVHFNNQKEVEVKDSNYLVEINNLREVQKTVEPVKVEVSKTKEVLKTIKEEVVSEPTKTVEKTTVIQQETLPQITKVEEEEIVTQQDDGPDIEKVEEEPIVEYVKPVTEEAYLEQTNLEKTNYVIPDVQEYNANNYSQQPEITTTTTTTTVTESANDGMTMGMGQEIGYETGGYGASGYEYAGQSKDQTAQLRSSEIIKKTEFLNSINRAIVNESTNKTLFTKNTLPVKVLKPKINEVIFDSNVKTLPVIFGGKNVTFDNQNTRNSYYGYTTMSTPVMQNYTLQSTTTNYSY